PRGDDVAAGAQVGLVRERGRCPRAGVRAVLMHGRGRMPRAGRCGRCWCPARGDGVAAGAQAGLVRERGPAKNQMMKPTIGRMMINSVHRILAPVEAVLPMMLTIAQMSRASTIRPKMNSKATSLSRRVRRGVVVAF